MEENRINENKKLESEEDSMKNIDEKNRSITKKSRNKKLIIVSVLIVCVLGSVGSYLGYGYYIETKIRENSIKIEKEIKTDFEAFEKAKEDEERIKLIKDVETDLKNYKNDIKFGNQKDVIKIYDETLGDMKKYFTNSYEKILNDNTLTDEELAAVTDKNQLTEKKTNLDNLITTITKVEGVIIEKSYLNEKITVVNELKEKYDARYSAIEEEEKKRAEEEAARKAEEERKAAEAAKSSSGSRSGGSSSGKSNEEIYWWTEDGITTWHQGDKHWNSDGDSWTDEDLEGWR